MMIFHSYVNVYQRVSHDDWMKIWGVPPWLRKHPFAKFLVFQHPYFSGNIMLNHSQFKTLQVRTKATAVALDSSCTHILALFLVENDIIILRSTFAGPNKQVFPWDSPFRWFHKWENMRTQYKITDSIIFLAGSPANVDSLGITVWKITQNNLQPGGPVKKHEIYVISHFCWLLVD